MVQCVTSFIYISFVISLYAHLLKHFSCSGNWCGKCEIPSPCIYTLFLELNKYLQDTMEFHIPRPELKLLFKKCLYLCVRRSHVHALSHNFISSKSLHTIYEKLSRLNVRYFPSLMYLPVTEFWKIITFKYIEVLILILSGLIKLIN